MRVLVRPTQAVVFALAAGLSMTACGDNAADTAQSETTTTSAAHKSDAALTQDSFADRVFGAIAKAGSAKVHFTSDNGEDQPRGDGEVKYGGGLAMRINLTPYGDPNDTSEVLLVGNTMYVAGNGKYQAMSLHALESMGMPDIIGFLDPRSRAQVFRTAISEFKKAGAAETIGGVEATPYAITIDTSKAPKVYGSAASDVVHYTFYIGTDDLPRKLIYRDPYSEFTAIYSNWGAKVDIEVPAGDKVEGLPSASM